MREDLLKQIAVEENVFVAEVELNLFSDVGEERLFRITPHHTLLALRLVHYCQI